MSLFRGQRFRDGQLPMRDVLAAGKLHPRCGDQRPRRRASGVQTSKLNHRQHARYSQPEGTAVISEQRIVWITKGTGGTIVGFNVATKTACTGAGTITVNVLKNGTAILASAITLNSASPITAAIAGTLATTATAAGDVFEVEITATPSSGAVGQGIFAEIIVDEYPS